MKTDVLTYELPEELIAQRPLEQRDACRLLVLDRARQHFHETVFRTLPELLHAGDCVVLNDTRVIKARLRGAKPSGGRVEIFLLRQLAPGEWEALVRPSARVREGTEVSMENSLDATVAESLTPRTRRVRFSAPDVVSHLEQVGAVPLPPYIRRPEPDADDAADYQTVYARVPGAVAAPTAGLHFTPVVLDSLRDAGIACAYLTLHVGYGTFKPIETARIEEHRIEPEEFMLPEETARQLDATRGAGGRVIAVGTTVTRVLETQYREGRYQPGAGTTKCYIYPPYPFRAIDGLLTNFHLPRSSLLALVCAFGGTEFVLDAYRHAVDNQFRFYSYGDAMLIL